MKVAITGATGFLGRYLVSYLLDNLYDVLIITRGEERAKEYLPAGVSVYVTDYSFESLCEGLKEVETIIHLAAQTMQRDSDPFRVSQFFAVNITMTENLLLAAKQVGVFRKCVRCLPIVFIRLKIRFPLMKKTILFLLRFTV